ncbi:hypothetical protein Droror1_Dr00007128 [Drosera rotundifolia]
MTSLLGFFITSLPASPLLSTFSSLTLSPLLSPCHFVVGDSLIPISAVKIVAADPSAAPLAALQSRGCVSCFFCNVALCGYFDVLGIVGIVPGSAFWCASFVIINHSEGKERRSFGSVLDVIPLADSITKLNANIRSWTYDCS